MSEKRSGVEQVGGNLFKVVTGLGALILGVFGTESLKNKDN